MLGVRGAPATSSKLICFDVFMPFGVPQVPPPGVFLCIFTTKSGGHPGRGAWSLINIKGGESPRVPPSLSTPSTNAGPGIDGFPRLHDPATCGLVHSFSRGSKIRNTTVSLSIFIEFH